MKNITLIVIGTIISILYWFLDSFIDFHLGVVDEIELIPEEINEFWMRCLIVILIMTFSIYVQISQNRIRRIESEKVKLLNQKLDDQYDQLETSLDSRIQIQVALNNLFNIVSSTQVKIENGEKLSEYDVNNLSQALMASLIRLKRLGINT